MSKPTLYLCTGGRCRRALRRDGSLARELERLPVRVSKVGCQKVCRGPVVGIEVEGELRWFGSMDSPKAQQALAEWLGGDSLAKPLKKRRDRSRDGRLRG